MSNRHAHMHARRDALPEAAPEPVVLVQTVTNVVQTTVSSDTAATTAADDGIPKWVTAVINGDTVSWPNPAYTAATATAASTADAKTTSTTAASATSKTKSIATTSSTDIPSSETPTTAAGSTTSLAAASTTLVKAKTSTASAASSTSTLNDTDSSSSTGMSTGGKAGLAIGLLVGIFAILGLVFLCVQKRKKAAERQRLDDEKMGGNADFSGAARAASQRRAQQHAPRLSLRPTAQSDTKTAEKRASNRGNMLQINTAIVPTIDQNGSPRSPRSNPLTASNEKTNPFGNHAEALDTPNTNGPAMVQTVTPGGEVIMEGAVAGAAVAAAATAAPTLDRRSSRRGNGPATRDLTQNAAQRGLVSPGGTAVDSGTPTAGGAAIAQAGGPPPNSTVHRVQLDFAPSMDDELELRQGQLVRMLHEYDDGWALCIRLDRSKQGVAPRTCLSVRPVQPRPQQGPGHPGPGPQGPGRPGPGPGFQGPPPPGMRGSAPPGFHGPPINGPMSPGMGPGPNGRQGSPMGRPMTPNGGQGRPMTPNGGRGPNFPQQGRSASPGPNSPRSRSRSPSTSQAQRPHGPPGPSPMNPNVGSQVPAILMSGPDSHPDTPGTPVHVEDPHHGNAAPPSPGMAM